MLSRRKVHRCLPSATYIRRERVSLQPQASAADWLWPPRGSASEVKRAERVRGANEARLHNAIRTLGSLTKRPLYYE